MVILKTFKIPGYKIKTLNFLTSTGNLFFLKDSSDSIIQAGWG